MTAPQREPPPSDTLKIQWREVPLSKVMHHFIRGYGDSGEFVDSEWFLDAVHGVVVFKLYLPEAAEKKAL